MRRLTCLFVSLIAFLSLAAPAVAAPGDLDTSFNGSGKIISDYGTATAKAVALQSDGKIVVVSSNATSMRLARYNPNGSPDTGFGTGGVVSTNGAGNAVYIEPSGKILVGGSRESASGTGQYEVVLSKFLTDGSVDSGYGSGTGSTTSSFGSAGSTRAFGAEFGPNGTLYVVGVHLGPAGSQQDSFAVAAYNPNGLPDTDFGGGMVQTDLTPYSDRAFAAAVQPDGKLVVAGSTAGGATFGSFALARYNPDGSLDPAFGTNGKVMGENDGFLFGVALGVGGDIIGVGTTAGDLAVASYNEDGSLYNGFGQQGVSRFDPDYALPGYTSAEALTATIDPEGRIIVVGRLFNLYEPRSGAFLARIQPWGALDRSFGDGGTITTQFSWESGFRDVLLQADGKILTAGGTGEPSLDSAVFRYIGGDGPMPPFYELFVSKTGTGVGYVSGAGIGCGNVCGAEYKEGKVITLTAYPETGSQFVGWSGDCAGTGTCEVTMDDIKHVTAEFALTSPPPPSQETLSLRIVGSGAGEVLVSPSESGEDHCSGPLSFPAVTCNFEFDAGTQVTLKASEPAAATAFVGWSGDCAGTGATCEVTMDDAKIVTAEFAHRSRTEDQPPGGSPSSTPPASGSAPVAETSSPPVTKPLKCRKGFKKRKTKGKQKCVKMKRKPTGKRGGKVKRLGSAAHVSSLKQVC